MTEPFSLSTLRQVAGSLLALVGGIDPCAGKASTQLAINALCKASPSLNMAMGYEDMQVGMLVNLAWARCGYQRFEADRDTLMLLAATSLRHVEPSDVRAPHSAFLIHLPPKLVFIADANGEPTDVVAIQAWQYENVDIAAFQWSIVSYASSGVISYKLNIIDHELIADSEFDPEKPPNSLPELAKVQKYDLDSRADVLIRRIVAGVCLLIASHTADRNSSGVSISSIEQKAKRGRPPSRIHRISRKRVLPVIFRDTLAGYISGDRSSPNVRFVVRGHWRNQACGPRLSERRMQWIQPFWKGPVGGMCADSITEIR